MKLEMYKVTIYFAIYLIVLQTLKTCYSFSLRYNTMHNPITQTLQYSSSEYLKQNDDVDDDSRSSDTHFIFPGGGIFFYWQAGVITYLREQNYILTGTTSQQIKYTGASAGALCATLTTTNVDFIKATELALQKSDDVGVWDRPLGLAGVWGGIIEEWLDELLPNDSIELIDDQVSLLFLYY